MDPKNAFEKTESDAINNNSSSQRKNSSNYVFSTPVKKNLNGHNSVNFKARSLKFCMEVDLDLL